MIGRGESYRPGGGPPYQPPRPEIDSYRSDIRGNTYAGPSRDRPRSRTPPFRRRSRSRGRDEGPRYSDRARSPRRFSPRRDDRLRSPPRRRSRSPFSPRRDRSPPIRRGRSPSPYSRRSPPPRRYDSPPRSRYDRPRSPRRGFSPPRDGPRGGNAYRTRSRSPVRSPPPRRKDPYTDDNWRRRSPSPRAGPAGRGSGPGSATDSRRSSPPLHPDRASLAGSRAPSPGYRGGRNQFDSRRQSPPSRARSPPPLRRDRSPPDHAMQDVSPPSQRQMADRTREPSVDTRNGTGTTTSIQPPTGPRDRGGAYNPRPPPSGPASTQRSPPVGPSQSAPMSMSAHNRGTNAAILSAPTRPRGAAGGPPPRGPSGYPAGPSSRSAVFNQREGGGPPSGPRANSFAHDRPPPHSTFNRNENPVNSPQPFRHSNNSSSTTYPRSQRFDTPSNPVSKYLSSTEKIIPGGKLLPSGLPPDQERRMKQLEADADKLREMIAEKQKGKRSALREWDDRTRESESAALRSELAERHLEKLTEGEDGLGGAAF